MSLKHITVCAGLIASSAIAFFSTPAQSVTITPNFSNLGSITQDGNPKGKDVTDIVISDINAAIDIWESAILRKFDLGIEFRFADLSDRLEEGIPIGLHTLGMEDPDTKFIKKSLIEFHLPSQTTWFFDPTPLSNEEFKIRLVENSKRKFDSPSLPKFTSVVGVKGSAIAGRGAEKGFDFFSVALHEIGHALGLSSRGTLYKAETQDGDIDIDFLESFLLASGDIPVKASHFDGKAKGGLFEHTLMADPSFGSGERVLPSPPDVWAIGSVYNLTRNEINPNVSISVPEPTSILSLLTLGFLGAASVLKRKQKQQKLAISATSNNQ